MALAKKVMWIEGMFLRPHHFQEQDLRSESLLRSALASIQPHYWGFSRIEIDETALSTGKVALAACEGVFPDGLAFSFPGDAVPVRAVEVDSTDKDVSVWLAVPSVTPGARLAAPADETREKAEARYTIEAEEVGDLLDPSSPPELLQFGRPSLRLVIGPRPREGFEALEIARVREVTSNRQVVLDGDFIPPVLSVQVSTPLTRNLRELVGLFNQRAERLAGHYSSVGGSSVSAQQQFMLLLACNRWGVRLHHMCDMRERSSEGRPHLHPSVLHRDLVEAAAEIATFTQTETRRAPSFPSYDHDALSRVFPPVIAELRRGLGALVDEKAVSLELTYSRKYSIYHNRSIDSSLLKNTRLILVARAQMLEDDFRRDLPRRVSIGSTQDIRQIIGAADRNVPLRPLSSFPAEIRPLSGWTPFELDQKADDWRGIVDSQSIAIHVQDVFQDLEMTLWAIRD